MTPKNSSANPICSRFSPVFASRNFIVLPFTFISMVHFELVFVDGVSLSKSIPCM